MVQESNKEVDFGFNDKNEDEYKRLKNTTRTNYNANKYNSQERHQKSGSSIHMNNKIKQIQLKSRNIISRQFSNDPNTSNQQLNK